MPLGATCHSHLARGPAFGGPIRGATRTATVRTDARAPSTAAGARVVVFRTGRKDVLGRRPVPGGRDSDMLRTGSDWHGLVKVIVAFCATPQAAPEPRARVCPSEA